MRIEKISAFDWGENGEILFDNGNRLGSDHCPDCCEWNYADFSNLDTEIMSFDFPEKLEFESVDGYGFRFGGNGRMFFVPCYSVQNGYYSSDVEIYYSSASGEILHHFSIEAEEEFG